MKCDEDENLLVSICCVQRIFKHAIYKTFECNALSLEQTSSKIFKHGIISSDYVANFAKQKPWDTYQSKQ